jgi:hypothetical protein
MVLLQSEVQKTVAERMVMKVNSQPTSNDLNLLEEELIAIAASIPSVLGGGMNGHAGMLLSDVDYATMAPGTSFVAPINPGVYPFGVTAEMRSQMEAEHKEQIKQFHTFVGVGMGLKDLILKAIDKDYLLEIKHKHVAFLNVTAMQMLTHLHNCWGVVEFVNITALMAECNAPWSVNEVPTLYFNWVEKAMKQLAKANINWERRAMMNKVLKSFKDAGSYKPAIRKWEAWPVATQTWDNLKILMCTEYAKAHHQNGVSARAKGHTSAHNVMEEYAAATEELMENLTKGHTKQVEALIKANNNNMAKLMEVLSKATPMATPAAATLGKTKSKRNAEKHKAWIEKCKNATKCKHCNKVHPNCTEAQCWELKGNAAKRPANWKSVKSSWQCTGPSVTTETQKSKVKSVDTYFNAANYWAPLTYYDNDDDSDKDIENYPSKQKMEHGYALTKPP